MGDHDTPGIGELSRQVRDVLLRFEGLATRLETQFVRSDNFNLYKQLVDQSIAGLESTIQSLARKDRLDAVEDDLDDKCDKATVNALTRRVDDLEDGKKWLTRLVVGFIILGVLGAIFTLSQGPGIK